MDALDNHLLKVAKGVWTQAHGVIDPNCPLEVGA
jgi:hypothetical protein